MSPEHDGHLNYWVTIDLAATALDVTTKRAYKLAKQHHWRHTQNKRPRGYLMADIATTARQRKDKQ